MKNFLKAAFAAGIFTTFCATCQATFVSTLNYGGLFTFSNITCTSQQAISCADLSDFYVFGTGTSNTTLDPLSDSFGITDFGYSFSDFPPGFFSDNVQLKYTVTYNGTATQPTTYLELAHGAWNPALKPYNASLFDHQTEISDPFGLANTTFTAGATFQDELDMDITPFISTSPGPDTYESFGVSYTVEDPILTPEPSTLSYTSLFAVVGLLVAVQQVRRTRRFKRDGC